MLKFIALLYAAICVNSIYDYSIQSTTGAVINLSDFQGKKILFVNTASNSPYANQYGRLEQLHQQFHDSLVIIAVPSNSFGNEPLTNEAIQSQVAQNYNIHYLLAQKLEVSGVNITPVYQWLTQIALNGQKENPVPGDFTKYLVDETGTFKGIFAPSVDPLSEELTSALHD